jgi:cell division protein ZapA
MSEADGERKGVTVNIFREVLTLHGTADPDFVRRLAAYVDERMREVAEKVPHAPFQRVAVLAALNIAADLFFLEDEAEDLELGLKHLDATSNELLLLLEEELTISGASEGSFAG